MRRDHGSFYIINDILLMDGTCGVCDMCDVFLDIINANLSLDGVCDVLAGKSITNLNV